MNIKETFCIDYPILAVPMNQVSNMEFARNCKLEGIYPSLTIFDYYQNGQLEINKLVNDLEIYNFEFVNCNFLLSLSTHDLINNRSIINIIIDNKIKSIEILGVKDEHDLPLLQQLVDYLRSNGVKVFLKIPGLVIKLDTDGLILKGEQGAGKTLQLGRPLKDAFIKARNLYKDKIIIPSGGISTSSQVKEFLDLGADLVGVGTLFAASKESPISDSTKQLMVNASSDDLQRFQHGGQQGLIFSTVDNDDANHTYSLAEGIKTGQTGHVYAGWGIDQITDILPLKTIIQNLIKDL
jgi:NAD(P)H-dependent flavin oxidoreductase YrpB (nitropropane dioxygenase family)